MEGLGRRRVLVAGVVVCVWLRSWESGSGGSAPWPPAPAAGWAPAAGFGVACGGLKIGVPPVFLFFFSFSPAEGTQIPVDFRLTCP